MSDDENGGDGRRNVGPISVDSLQGDQFGWSDGERDPNPTRDRTAPTDLVRGIERHRTVTDATEDGGRGPAWPRDGPPRTRPSLR